MKIKKNSLFIVSERKAKENSLTRGKSLIKNEF